MGVILKRRSGGRGQRLHGGEGAGRSDAECGGGIEQTASLLILDHPGGAPGEGQARAARNPVEVSRSEASGVSDTVTR
jgi:hypothetical protein